ncbi:transglycosylase family protein [Streptomyces sp. NPDC052225]|uniref:transglycosylase family protein n=1 Tax=Streptomyces sp. NPDC052225 TaxID=3154949 RepID=UPI00343E37A3
MLSGNGRHRRPRQAPALIVAAGVTGSAIAIPLLAATNASAASTHAWDKLAECESGGQWSLDAGNGYYGGLQFSQEMWEQYGGLDYAPRADLASRSQQIAVAEKVLDARGTAAWPSCSLAAGLSKSDDSADVDPGTSPSPQASDADTSSGEKNHDGSDDSDTASDGASTDASGDTSGNGTDGDKSDTAADESSNNSDKSEQSATTPSADPGDSAGPADSADPADASGSVDPAAPESSASATPDPSATGGDASAAGRHRGDRAADDDADSRTGEGRHASRDDKRGDGTYTVRSGDNLWDIADAQDVDGGWAALYDRNKKEVGSDPDLIIPGQSLDLGLESVEK